MNATNGSVLSGAARAGGASTTASTPPRPRPRRRHLNSRQLHRLWWAEYKRWQKLKKLAEADPFLASVAELADKAQREIHALSSRRELQEARDRDAELPATERVCWELFGPSFGWLRGDRHKRTVNTMETHYSSIEPSVRPAEPSSAYADLERELKFRPLDVAKFSKHVDEVLAKYRRWLSQGGPEREAA